MSDARLAPNRRRNDQCENDQGGWQEPVHGDRAGDIIQDGVERVLLGAGEGEGQRRLEAGQHLRIAREFCPDLQRRAPEQDGKLVLIHSIYLAGMLVARNRARLLLTVLPMGGHVGARHRPQHDSGVLTMTRLQLTQIRLRLADERGIALAMALGILVVLAIMLTAVIDYSASNAHQRPS